MFQQKLGDRILTEEGDVLFFESFFNPADSDRWFAALQEEIVWKQEAIRLYGRSVAQPRLTAWYGDTGIEYCYSGLRLTAIGWTPILLEMKAQIEAVPGVAFNSVLLNLYRDGQDSMGWHSDDEPELGQNPPIGSVSFGGTRRFQLRHRYNKSLKRTIELTHGSYLLMQGATQHFWQHQIPKTARSVEPRINLTFRVIKNVNSTA